MKKVVVIGANGFTGRRILQSLSVQARHEVCGVSLNPDNWRAPGYRFIQADITDHDAIRRLLNEIRPDVVINTAALSVPDYCELHKEEAQAVNVEAVRNLIECCNVTESRLIHLSTDFVFDGKNHYLYTEDDQPSPVNYYGQTKWLGEQAVASEGQDYAIARVVLVYGQALPGQHGNIIQLVRNKLSNNEPIRVVADQWRTPTWVGDVVKGVEQLISYPGNGIYHICGDECLSIAEIAYRVADFFRLDSSLILPVTTADLNEAVRRPTFSGLSNWKARRNFQFQAHSLEEGLQHDFKR